MDEGFGEDYRACHIQVGVVAVVVIQIQSQPLDLLISAVVQIGNTPRIQICLRGIPANGGMEGVGNAGHEHGHHRDSPLLAGFDYQIVVVDAVLGHGLRLGTGAVPQLRHDGGKRTRPGNVSHAGSLLIAGIVGLDQIVPGEIRVRQLIPPGVIAQKRKLPG